MLKLKNIEKEKFDEFVKNHPTKSHFLQSVAWGDFSKAKKNYTPYFLGLVNENDEIVATTLLLQKHLPMGMCYFYAPRGFVLDYNKKELVRTMSKKVVEFAKSKKAIFVKIDPDIIRKSYNYNDEENELSTNPEEVFETLKSCGFKHLGFTKNFETMQPRYSFRVDLTQDLDTIKSHFSKTTTQRINKSLKLQTEVELGTIDDIKDFYNLMMITESRKDFVSYTEDYYRTLFEIFNKNENSKALLFLGKVDLNKTINALEENLKGINDQLALIPVDSELSRSARNKLNELTKQKENVEKDIEKYNNYKKEYGEKLTLSAHMIIEYGDKAWVLYAGNHNILTESYVNYNTYFEHLKRSKEDGLKIYDQFGTIGDLSKDNPRLGLHEFKKKFGGDYVEFLGEWDYVTNPLMYFVFTKLVPLYRNIIRKRTKKVIEHEVSEIK